MSCGHICSKLTETVPASQELNAPLKNLTPAGDGTPFIVGISPPRYRAPAKRLRLKSRRISRAAKASI
jgi:hypothetical protein